MQESVVGAWRRESQLSGANLHCLRDLNVRFLQLVGTAPGGWSGQRAMPTHIAARVASMLHAEREAAASCPYALFDLRFRDTVHWQERLRNPHHWRVADESAADAATVEFVRVALFYAWHIASQGALKAQLLLGMSSATAAALRAATVDGLPFLAITESVHLSARWSDCSAYWAALIGAAAAGNPAKLRRVQLHGLQLAAALRLTD